MKEKIWRRIEMAPFAKARPRVTKKGTYMPKKYVANRDGLRALYLEAGGRLNQQGMLRVSAQFWFRMPGASWSEKKREETAGTYCGKKPDLDNLLGAVMDALLVDDSKVVELGVCEKRWGYFDAIYIMIEEIDNG